MGKLVFIGAGNMAEALIKGVIESGVFRPADILISDVRVEQVEVLKKRYGVALAKSNAEAASKADILVLSVKPQNMDEVLEEIKGSFGSKTLIISIAAGVRTEKIARILGDAAIVRVMPNTPALVGEGMIALFANEKGRARLKEAAAIFDAVGKTVILDDESLMDAVTAVSGSGPAYFFLLMEQMIMAGIELGLPAETAKQLVLQTAKGAAELAMAADKSGEGPAELRQKVTSRGGTTQAAIEELQKGQFDSLVVSAIKRAAQRSRDLSS